MIRPILTVLVFSIIILSGCVLKEMMDKTQKIKELVMDNCDCDNAQVVSYEEKNLRTTAQVHITGADTTLRKEIALKINSVLKKEIKDYCDIDVFEMVFINKGRYETITFKHCEMLEEEAP